MGKARRRGITMIVKNEREYCWCVDDVVGEPQSSIRNAIADFLKNIDDLYDDCDSDHMYMGDGLDIETVEIGQPYYFVPKVDGKKVIDDVVNDWLSNETIEYPIDYLRKVKCEHIDELSDELSKVFQAWEKRHGYENSSYVVMETEQYLIGDYVKE